MKNEFKVIENETVLFETANLSKAYDFSRSVLKDEAKVGTIHQILKNGELFDETISVKQANGKVVMMLLDRYQTMTEKANQVATRRATEAAEAQAKKEAREKTAQLKEALQTAKANFKAQKAILMGQLEALQNEFKAEVADLEAQLNEVHGVDTESVQDEVQDTQEGMVHLSDIFKDVQINEAL